MVLVKAAQPHRLLLRNARGRWRRNQHPGVRRGVPARGCAAAGLRGAPGGGGAAVPARVVGGALHCCQSTRSAHLRALTLLSVSEATTSRQAAGWSARNLGALNARNCFARVALSRCTLFSYRSRWMYLFGGNFTLASVFLTKWRCGRGQAGRQRNPHARWRERVLLMHGTRARVSACCCGHAPILGPPRAAWRPPAQHGRGAKRARNLLGPDPIVSGFGKFRKTTLEIYIESFNSA